MNVEFWSPDRHLSLLGEWLSKRGQADNAGDARLYPSTGFVVDQCVIGFLYATDAPYLGFLDGFVTDPAASARRRLAALERLCAALTGAADARGIKVLVASTNVRGLQRLSRRHGFSKYGDGFEMVVRNK